MGGGLIDTACLLSLVKAETFRDIFGIKDPEEEVKEVLLDSQILVITNVLYNKQAFALFIYERWLL